jgi:hypothetical protein
MYDIRLLALKYPQRGYYKYPIIIGKSNRESPNHPLASSPFPSAMIEEDN